MTQKILDWKKYSQLAREAAADGCVLLKNQNHSLPILPNETCALFGRTQIDYVKSGTGSGGMVNVPYVRTIVDGLEAKKDIKIYQPLLVTYKNWLKDHPFDKGTGWGQEPWSQIEMPLTDALVADAAANSDLAIIVIGRTAGEDRDNSATKGSFYLTDAENDMLAKVCHAFSRTIVVLNVGNIIDMSWVDIYEPSAVLYIWQGGMEGGDAAADILTGAVCPSGKLADTIAYHVEDYPAYNNFGSQEINYYQEDIYVGYRYFETFAPDKVRYPFGFGLSYTDFSASYKFSISDLKSQNGKITVEACVKNVGSCPGKEVVQIYACPPQGKLGKPLRNLCAFSKTALLNPGEEQNMEMEISLTSLASYDDSGITGHKSCFVLEEGEYVLYAGTDVKTAEKIGSFCLSSLIVTQTCEEAMTPVKNFQRIKPASDNQGNYIISYEPTPLRTIDLKKRIADRREKLSASSCIGDQGWKLMDVKAGTVSMDDFLSQLTDEALCLLVNGEGMCSPKVTPGTAAAFGGLTDSLKSYGIPTGCCSDGPSGIRMDCGTNAFSLPNGTLLACTFDPDVVSRLFEMEGIELYANRIDALLGPGINIHRCPLNGRNFEYHSEDPYLTGMMAIAQLNGLQKSPVTGTLKHFCGNNQELGRHTADSIISERALREIYLRPFEMSVRMGNANSIMTTYGPVNGFWTAGNYDLVTTILRGEWKFQGIVMSDWWAKANEEDSTPDRSCRTAMVRAQNDLFMVTTDTTTDKNDLEESLHSGALTRGELLRSAKNICSFLMHSVAYEIMTQSYCGVEHQNTPVDPSLLDASNMETLIVEGSATASLESYEIKNGSTILLALSMTKPGYYRFTLSATTDAPELAQMAVVLSINNTVKHTYFYHGGQTETDIQRSEPVEIRFPTGYLRLAFPLGGVKPLALTIERVPTPKNCSDRALSYA